MTGPPISLCVITGNEEAAIERFLESFKDAFDELCIVRAVGATTHDRTLSIAKAWCAKNGKDFVAGEYRNAVNETGRAPEPGVVDDMNPATWPHVDDFGEARNASWKLASGDWQFWADVDDLLQPGTPEIPGGAELIRLCAGAGTHDYFHFTYDIRLQNEANLRERLFRRGMAQWIHPVHETCRMKPAVDDKPWKGLQEPRVVFEHAPQVGKPRDPMRNRRIMGYHLRYLARFAFEMHREYFFDWQFSRKAEDAELATKWAEIAHATDTIPEQRYDLFLHQSQIAEGKDLVHAADLTWSAIRLQPRCRDAWGHLAEYELKAGHGERAALATGFMQAIPKPQDCGYPQSNQYHGWQGAHLRARALRAAGKEDLARKTEDALFEANGRRVSLLHATRGRPTKALETRNLFYRTAFIPLGVEHIFAIDADDKESIEALKHYRHVIVENPRGCVKAWNAAAAASAGHVMIQLSDDWRPPGDWDIIIWEELARAALKRLEQPTITTPIAEANAIASVPLVLAVHDGHRNDHLLCMAILTRARYESDAHRYTPGVGGPRHIFHPDYFGVFSDNEFTLRAYADGVVVQAQHIQFAHDHPLFSGKPLEELDATYQRQNHPDRYKEGLETFRRRNPDAP